ncbi:hypothetical protein F2P81_003856 [Scophthalmus maximus]|uniref:Uncharacterized protein n=1 Tax=Scophthalmus maximus TaxID=52904 RepID=A0A6A4TJQ7_SCOMX|nr:hypothetical protein F2P81_003856 [Scophthalmus maximus]
MKEVDEDDDDTSWAKRASFTVDDPLEILYSSDWQAESDAGQASSLDIRHFLVSVTLLIRFKVPVAELRPWCELEQVNCDQL